MKKMKLRVDFVSGCARSGTTLLFQLLSSSRELWSLYREEHGIYEWDIGLHPDYVLDVGNVLTADEATTPRCKAIRTYLNRHLSNSEWLRIDSLTPEGNSRKLAFRLACHASRNLRQLLRQPCRAIDKNPKHTYRTGFLKAVFPDAKFIFIVRDARSNIASLMEGWEMRRFETYRIPASKGEFQWSFELPPGWQLLLGRSLPEIAASQWVSANTHILQASEQWPEDCLVMRYEDLVKAPESELVRACGFLGIRTSLPMLKLARVLPVVNSLSAPKENKWRQRQGVIESVRDIYAPLQARLGYPA